MPAQCETINTFTQISPAQRYAGQPSHRMHTSEMSFFFPLLSIVLSNKEAVNRSNKLRTNNRRDQHTCECFCHETLRVWFVEISEECWPGDCCQHKKSPPKARRHEELTAKFM